MKIKDFALIIISVILISVLLSLFNILSFSFIDILSYLLLTIGITIVYIESVRRNRFSVFLGTIIFLLGVYFLVSQNFSLNIDERMSVSLILIFAGIGLLILHISTSTRKIFLVVSLILLTAGLTLFLINSHWNISTFAKSVIPVLSLLWPVLIIIGVLIFLLKRK